MAQMPSERILALDDATALNLLATVAKAHQHDTPPAPGVDAAAIASLRTHLVTTAEADPPPTDADAARAALALLAEDARFAGPIQALLDGPRPQAMGLGVVRGTLLVAALIFVLQTHVNFERTLDARWTFKFEKKPTADQLLVPIVKKLASLMGP